MGQDSTRKCICYVKGCGFLGLYDKLISLESRKHVLKMSGYHIEQFSVGCFNKGFDGLCTLSQLTLQKLVIKFCRSVTNGKALLFYLGVVLSYGIGAAEGNRLSLPFVLGWMSALPRPFLLASSQGTTDVSEY